MKLYYKKLGKGIPCVIIHGLYGSSDNWLSIARELSVDFEVYVVDLRNHGNSPHSDEFSIKAMAEDIHEFFIDMHLSKVVLMGHSLGGKVAMEFALEYQELLAKLIIVDIAPRNYLEKDFIGQNNHKEIINILREADLSKYKNRGDALAELGKIDESGRLKFFMMKNIKRGKNGVLEWKINIKAIADNLSMILNQFDIDVRKITIPTLFIKGEQSKYITAEDIIFLTEKMKRVRIETIKGASHWLHSEKPQEFVKLVKEFVKIKSGTRA